jgi:hypothetical protein
VNEASIESPAWFRAALATTFTALAGWQLWALGFGDSVLVAKAGLLKDDAFFYSVLVDNFREHGFFTLDGEMRTNGFQPLWMFILLGLKSVLPFAETLRLLQGLSWVSWLAFSWGAIWLVSRGTAFGATIRSLIVGGLLINNSRLQDALVEGLEVPLALALLVWTLVYVDSLSRRIDAGARGVRTGAALGALGGLLFLARTDLFWAAPILGLWAFERSGRAWKPLLACGAVTVAIVWPYLLSNLLTYGDLMPISSRVKLYLMQAFLPTWDDYWASHEWHGLPSLFQLALPKLGWKTTVGVSTSVLIFADIIAWSRWGRRALPDALRLLAVVASAHAIYFYFGYRELRPYTNYYFAPEFLLVVLVFAWSISLVRGRVAALGVMAWVLVTSSASWDVRKPRADAYWSSRVALAEKLPELTKGETAAAFWPGAFASFSGLDIVPLDGVIGSHAFFADYVKSGREIDYLREHRVRWIVVHARKAGDILGSKKPKAPTWSEIGQLRLWEARADLRHAHKEGSWQLFELNLADTEAPSGGGTP